MIFFANQIASFPKNNWYVLSSTVHLCGKMPAKPIKNCLLVAYQATGANIRIWRTIGSGIQVEAS